LETNPQLFFCAILLNLYGQTNILEARARMRLSFGNREAVGIVPHCSTRVLPPDVFYHFLNTAISIFPLRVQLLFSVSSVFPPHCKSWVKLSCAAEKLMRIGSGLLGAILRHHGPASNAILLFAGQVGRAHLKSPPPLHTSSLTPAARLFFFRSEFPPVSSQPSPMPLRRRRLPYIRGILPVHAKKSNLSLCILYPVSCSSLPAQDRLLRVGTAAFTRPPWQTSLVLLLALVTAAPLHVLAQPEFCSPGASTACASVLVIYGSSFQRGADVQTKLLDTRAFTTVDTFDARSDTPTAELLAAYHAVLVFSDDRRFGDGALLGDRLAAYHDQGGGVVVAAHEHECHPDLRVGGAYGTVDQGYALLDRNSPSGCTTNPGSDSLGDVPEPQSPLLASVASLVASYAIRSTAPVVSGRGVVVAAWRGGGQEPLVVRGARGNRTLVELNFFPVSNHDWSGFWAGDGAALLRNALKYSRCMLCGPGAFPAAGEAWAFWRKGREIAKQRKGGGG
jgi:hypothetical protein